MLHHTQNKFKMDERLNVKPETIKILQGSIGSKVSDTACSNILSDISPQVGEKINNCDYINKIKRHPTKWENMFTNTSDKGLVSEIYKELTKCNTKKTNSPVKKWAKDLNKHFFKEDIEMANGHVKRCSPSSLIIREMQIKPQWDITSHLSEWLSSTNQQTTSAGKDVQNGWPFCTVGGNADWCSLCGIPQKIKNGSAIWHSDPTSGNISKETQTLIPVKGEIIWYLPLTIWLISLSIMLSSSIHAIANGT